MPSGEVGRAGGGRVGEAGGAAGGDGGRRWGRPGQGRGRGPGRERCSGRCSPGRAPLRRVLALGFPERPRNHRCARRFAAATAFLRSRRPEGPASVCALPRLTFSLGPGPPRAAPQPSPCPQPAAGSLLRTRSWGAGARRPPGSAASADVRPAPRVRSGERDWDFQSPAGASRVHKEDPGGLSELCVPGVLDGARCGLDLHQMNVSDLQYGEHSRQIQNQAPAEPRPPPRWMPCSPALRRAMRGPALCRCPLCWEAPEGTVLPMQDVAGCETVRFHCFQRD